MILISNREGEKLKLGRPMRPRLRGSESTVKKVTGVGGEREKGCPLNVGAGKNRNKESISTVGVVRRDQVRRRKTKKEKEIPSKGGEREGGMRRFKRKGSMKGGAKVTKIGPASYTGRCISKTLSSEKPANRKNLRYPPQDPSQTIVSEYRGIQERKRRAAKKKKKGKGNRFAFPVRKRSLGAL